MSMLRMKGHQFGILFLPRNLTLVLGPLESRQQLTVLVDGEPVPAFAGESVATVLLAHGRPTFRHTEHGAPRGLFCGMGIGYMDASQPINTLRTRRAPLDEFAYFP